MHYRDGQEAKLGDLVSGTPYNTPHVVVGQVVGLVPGADACNLRVTFIEATALARLPDFGVSIPPTLGAPRMAQGGMHLWSGANILTANEPPHALWACVDYGSTKEFSLITRSPKE